MNPCHSAVRALPHSAASGNLGTGRRGHEDLMCLQVVGTQQRWVADEWCNSDQTQCPEGCKAAADHYCIVTGAHNTKLMVMQRGWFISEHAVSSPYARATRRSTSTGLELFLLLDSVRATGRRTGGSRLSELCCMPASTCNNHRLTLAVHQKTDITKEYAARHD